MHLHHNNSSIYTSILISCGWNPIIQTKSLFTNNWVGCLSHTAGPHEFFLWLLYIKNHEDLSRTCLLMADNPKFEKFPYKQILDSVNVIRLSDKRWKTKQGYVEKIVDIIKKKKYNICVLAPSGKDKQPLPWKTGYYYIAKSLGWDLRVVGFDFETKRLKVGNIISSAYEIAIAQEFLQKEMEDIVPLRPQNSWTAVRNYDKKKLSFIKIDPILTLFIISLISWIIIMKIYKIGFVDILISTYGFLLQLYPNILIKIIGFSIIYQHIFVKYMEYSRAPETIIILGALSGVLIGVKNKNAYVYIPLIYSFLSKVPVYVTDLRGQFRVIIMTVILSIVLGEYTSKHVRIAKKSTNIFALNTDG
jgi:hypothetical protein